MDFDDLLANTVELLRTYPEVLEHYQRRFRTCSSTSTRTPTGSRTTSSAARRRRTATSASSATATSASRRARWCAPRGEVAHRAGRRSATRCSAPRRRPAAAPVDRDGVKVGRCRRAPRHRGARPEAAPCAGTPAPHRARPHRPCPADQWLVYLMERADRGYRIGRDHDRPLRRPRRADLGFRVRVNQEHGDTLWILQVCATPPPRPPYWETCFAADYGLPTACFHGVGSAPRRWTKSGIERLYAELDTETRAKQLMDDLLPPPGLPAPPPPERRSSPDAQPHDVLRSAHGRSGPPGAVVARTGLTSPALRSTAGFNVRPGDSPAPTASRPSRKDYAEAVELARAAARRRWPRHPPSGASRRRHLRPHPALAPAAGHERARAEPRTATSRSSVDVVEVRHTRVPSTTSRSTRTHTYVADGVLVHNSIYRFRGADMRNILEFEKAFPDGHRGRCSSRTTGPPRPSSTPPTRSSPTTWPASPRSSGPTGHGRAPSSATTPTTRPTRPSGSPTRSPCTTAASRWGDCAVFYRTNAQSRVLEEYLIRAGIPYKVVGGTRFYDRREVKDAVAYLQAAVNPADEVSVKRVLNVPKRGVGDSTVGRARRLGRQPRAHLHRRAAAGRRRRRRRPGRQGHRGLPRAARRAQRQPRRGPRAAARGGARAHRLRRRARGRALHRGRGPHREPGRAGGRRPRVRVRRRVPRADQPGGRHRRARRRRVRRSLLMTLHAAKGLEFPVVFLIGLEDGVFPHVRSLGDPDELEEERRLAYVGITRARERLHLTHAWARTLYGATQYNPPSRFLDEIPSTLVTEVQGRRRASRSGGSWGGRSARSSRDDHDEPEAGSSAAGARPRRGQPGAGPAGGRPRAPRRRRPARLLGGRADRGRGPGAQGGRGRAPQEVGRGRDPRHRRPGGQERGPDPLPDGGEKRLLLAWAPVERA